MICHSELNEIYVWNFIQKLSQYNQEYFRSFFSIQEDNFVQIFNVIQLAMFASFKWVVNPFVWNSSLRGHHYNIVYGLENSVILCKNSSLSFGLPLWYLQTIHISTFICGWKQVVVYWQVKKLDYWKPFRWVCKICICINM